MKHIKMLRILSLALLLSLLLSLISCDAGEGAGDGSTAGNGGDTTAEPAPSDMILYSKDSAYDIIRSSWANDTAAGAVKKLREAIKEYFGGEWQPNISEDWDVGLFKDDIVDNDKYEILIGETNRRESKTVRETLGKDEYAIKAVGHKLVIVGETEFATVKAVEAFIDMYIKPAANSDTLIVPSNIDIRETVSIRQAELNNEAKYRLMTWNLGCDVGEAADAVEVILKYYPDVLALQEANKAVYTKVIKNLPDTYKVAQQYHVSTSTYVYTPIIYNSEVLTLKACGAEWLRDRYTETNTKCLEWAVFEDGNGALFADINFHGAICFNTYHGFENYTSAQLSAQAIAWRNGNVVQLMEVADSIMSQFGNIPIMINGDCNFNSSSAAYKTLISAGYCDAEFSARLGTVTGFNTYFAYGTAIKTGLSIDHIFGINDIDFVEHYIVRDKLVLTASDHCPVYVDFNPVKPQA